MRVEGFYVDQLVFLDGCSFEDHAGRSEDYHFEMNLLEARYSGNLIVLFPGLDPSMNCATTAS
jgi:hypothetical protein